jgi:hypothetical protein
MATAARGGRTGGGRTGAAANNDGGGSGSGSTSGHGHFSGACPSSLLMVSLSRFYSHSNHMERVLPYIVGESPVSLRLVDWFVTNYAKKHTVVLTRTTADGNVVHFNVHLSYRAQLKAYSKQQFDPFRRRQHIAFYYRVGTCVDTTVGQLNFFRWMLENDVLEYVVQNAADIEKDMMSAVPAGMQPLDDCYGVDGCCENADAKPADSQQHPAAVAHAPHAVHRIKGATLVAFD